MRFLVVEDDRTSRLLINKLLLEHGETDLAENGKVDLETYTSKLTLEEHHDVISLDIEMPIMSGQEMLMELRGLENRTGVHLNRA